MKGRIHQKAFFESLARCLIFSTPCCMVASWCMLERGSGSLGCWSVGECRVRKSWHRISPHVTAPGQRHFYGLGLDITTKVPFGIIAIRSIQTTGPPVYLFCPVRHENRICYRRHIQPRTLGCLLARFGRSGDLSWVMPEEYCGVRWYEMIKRSEAKLSRKNLVYIHGPLWSV